jgi:glycosyltransferase involved in cell wall biosynthesis
MYPPHHFGGYEAVWRSAVAYLRSRGHQVRVLATEFRHPGISDSDEIDVHRTLRWYWRDHDFANINGRERLRTERHNHAVLARHIDQLRPDVVSLWSMGGMSHSLIEGVRLRGLPMVAFVHDEWLNYGRHTDQWLRIFYRRRPAGPVVAWLTGLPTTVNYGAAGRYVFVSEFIRQRALSLDIGGLPDTAVAHSGIDPLYLDGAAELEREWRWRLLHVGRLHPDKGIQDAVTALKELPDKATLTFAGSWDPRAEDALGELVRELGLESRVTMLGQRPPAEIAALYRAHDALLFPVIWGEPWGLVPIEAMASGCPVIATGRGGSGEYLREGENCVLVSAEDPPGLAAAVRRLAGDPGLRRHLRAGGFESAPRYTETVFNEQVERHLADVAGQPIPTTEVTGA